MGPEARAAGVVLATALAAALPAPTLAEVAITHDAVDCVDAGSFPVIEARLEPPGDVERARVYFQARGTPHWYYVEMKRAGASGFAGTLPRPLESLDAFSYYIETVGPGVALGRSREYEARVVAASSGCPPGLAVATASTSVPSGLVVGAAKGAPAIPQGFSSLGLAGAAAGGVSTGLLVGIGLAGAAGAAVAVGVGGGDGGGSGSTGGPPAGMPNPNPTPAPTPLPAPDVTGRWVGQFAENASAVQCSVTSDLALDLQQSGTSVSGSFVLSVRAATPAPQDPCPVEAGDSFGGLTSGNVNGDTIELELQITGGPRFFLAGTVSTDRMGGTSPPDSEGPGGTWELTRQ